MKADDTPYSRDTSPYELATHMSLQRTLPTTWYRSADIFRIEKERIFCREWIAAGREEELPRPGDSQVLNVLGESILLVRNREGQLRAFYNVCRHRGARLCRDAHAEVAPGRVSLPGGVTAGRLIVCPYHQWSYDLNGSLVAAPHLGADAGFNKQEYSLYPVGVETWGGFVFLNLSPQMPSRWPTSWRVSRSACGAIRSPTCVSVTPFDTTSRRIGRSFARTTTSAITAAGCTPSSALWSPRFAMPGEPIWTGSAACRTGRAPIRLPIREPLRDGPSRPRRGRTGKA